MLQGVVFHLLMKLPKLLMEGDYVDFHLGIFAAVNDQKTECLRQNGISQSLATTDELLLAVERDKCYYLLRSDHSAAGRYPNQ